MAVIGVSERVVEDLERALALANRQFEDFAGLSVVDCYRNLAVVRVPEQPDVDTVARAPVELECGCGCLGVELIRVSRALKLDVWVDHAAFLVEWVVALSI
jgi:hypothetical protein